MRGWQDDGRIMAKERHLKKTPNSISLPEIPSFDDTKKDNTIKTKRVNATEIRA
jgi:hypothetical protein